MASNFGYLQLFPSRDGSLYSGKWSRAEEDYAYELIEEFKIGNLSIPKGTSLRGLLASRLGCSPKRVSKKFENTGYNGKQIYLGSSAKLTAEESLARKEKLEALREDFLVSRESLQECANSKAAKTQVPDQNGSSPVLQPQKPFRSTQPLQQSLGLTPAAYAAARGVHPLDAASMPAAIQGGTLGYTHNFAAVNRGANFMSGGGSNLQLLETGSTETVAHSVTHDIFRRQRTNTFGPSSLTNAGSHSEALVAHRAGIIGPMGLLSSFPCPHDSLAANIAVSNIPNNAAADMIESNRIRASVILGARREALLLEQNRRLSLPELSRHHHGRTFAFAPGAVGATGLVGTIGSVPRLNAPAAGYKALHDYNMDRASLMVFWETQQQINLETMHTSAFKNAADTLVSITAVPVDCDAEVATPPRRVLESCKRRCHIEPSGIMDLGIKKRARFT